MFPVWPQIAEWGWYVVGCLVLLCFLRPYIVQHYNKWRGRKDEDEYAAKYHKGIYMHSIYVIIVISTVKMSNIQYKILLDPDVALEMMSKVENARRKMQAQYNKSLEIAQEKEEEVISRDLS